MSTNSQVRPTSVAVAYPVNYATQPWLMQHFRSEDRLSQVSEEMAKILEIVALESGEQLNLITESLTNSLKLEQNAQYFYIILQGKVRITAWDSQKKQKVSVQILAEGDTFGDDLLFEHEAIAYEANAVTDVQLARMPLENLKPWLEKVSELRDVWLTTLKQRQSIIFFKTLTMLRSLPSHHLEHLIPLITEEKLPAGQKLAEVTSKSAGRNWLRSGKIENQSLTVGDTWLEGEQVKEDWRTESEVILYQLPKQAEAMVSTSSPRLAKALGIITLSTENLRGLKTAHTYSGVSPGNLTPSESPGVVTPPMPVADEAPVIEFAKPLKHRFKLWNRYPWMAQQSASDCGTACLAMISQFWGRRLSLNFLRSLAGVGTGGASLKSLAKVSESLGYQARPVRASISGLIEQKNPWIAHWQGDHYVVVYRVQDNRFLIADPASGKHLLSREAFLKSWTGYALLLDPTERLKEIPQEKRSLNRFFGLLLPYRSLGGQVILASFLIQIFGLVTPLFTQIILDQVVVNKSLTTLNVFALGLVLFGVWSIGLTAIRQYLLSYLANRLDLIMISGFIRHALLLPLTFFETRHVGDILTRVSENEKIQRFLISKVVLAWLDFLMGFVYLGLMFYYNWQLTLLVIGLIPPLVILTLAATPILRQVSRKIFNSTAEENSALVETITGIATVKATAAEQELRWRWEDRLTNSLNARFSGQKLAINLQSASGLINSLGSTALLWYGASLVIQDQLTIGQFVAFNMLIGKVLSPVLSLVNLWDELQEVLISVERLDDVFSVQSEEPTGNSLLVLPQLAGHIQFENVTFRYNTDEERNTLQNISFEVNPGQTIAIVGRSGSGKSTLVKLLQDLYQPNSGHIWIDGQDIKHVSPQSLRVQLGVVPQECFLFSGTIVENITLYRPEFTLEQVIAVAKLAEAHTFIQGMPLGYNTKVGERGSNLSGGQRQRIAIARALLGDPRILILDEATSSLDTESERRFQNNLIRISHNRTTFIIAHRLSTVRNADCILILDQGLLVEQGTHEELMLKQGLYYHLAQQQLDL